MKSSVILKTALAPVLMCLVQACAPASKNVVQEQPVEKNEVQTQKPAEPAETLDMRSKGDLMKVISAKTQGRFRPLYNSFLRKRPGFGGKITLKFKILADGSIETASVVSSDTGYDEFDAAVLDDLKQWNFGAGNYSAATVTIPFTFFE